MDKKVISTNRKAFHDYHIFDKYVAGIVLTGTEIKSIRKGMLNLKDSYAKIEDGEIFIYSMHISPYEQGNINPFTPHADVTIYNEPTKKPVDNNKPLSPSDK